MLSKEVISLVFDRRYDEARSFLCARQKEGDELSYRLAEFSEALQEKIGLADKGDASMRRVLAALHMLACLLMDQEYWGAAELVVNELVRLSLASSESFFLDDARFRRAVCLKALRRADEYEIARAEIPAGTSIFMADGEWRLRDIDDKV